jgi:hypothetical protein
VLRLRVLVGGGESESERRADLPVDPSINTTVFEFSVGVHDKNGFDNSHISRVRVSVPCSCANSAPLWDAAWLINSTAIYWHHNIQSADLGLGWFGAESCVKLNLVELTGVIPGWSCNGSVDLLLVGSCMDKCLRHR